jgi:hypothetical protein
MIDSQLELMRLTLEVGVPLRTHEIKTRNGPSDFDFERARQFGSELAVKGDVLQYGSKRKGEAADLMANLIDAVAILAFLPGGIDFLGLHWEAGK